MGRGGKGRNRVSIYKPRQLFWAKGDNEWRSLGPRAASHVTHPSQALPAWVGFRPGVG